MQLEHGAEIGHEFDPAGKPVVERAGRVERQALGPQRQRGRSERRRRSWHLRRSPPALSNSPGAVTRPSRNVLRPTKPGDEAVGRALIEVALAADLADLAVGHDDEPVGDGERLFLVVRHHDGGEAELALQLADLDPHLLAQLGVEVRQRLVEEEHVRPDRERAGEGDALLLAARELARQALRVGVEPHEPQGLLGARGDLVLRQPAHLETEGDVLGDAHVREKRVALEHHAGVAPPRPQVGDVDAADAGRAAARLDEAGDHAQGRRLAAAGRAEEHHELAVRHLEVHLSHGVVVAVALGQAKELEAGHQTTCAIFT